MTPLARWIYRRVRNVLSEETTPQPRTPDDIVREFHELFYNSAAATWDNTLWMGARVLKCPLDLWVYQEIIFDTRPDIIIESGTRHGGGALYFASLCDFLGHGRVLSIDIEDTGGRPRHPRITYFLGSSLSEGILREIEATIGSQAVMVSLDSDHQRSHVLAEMRAYGQYVTMGQYMIVEDTNLNGHPVRPDFGPGPMEAVEEFLRESDEFQVDRGREKFLLTFHRKGFLKKTK